MAKPVRRGTANERRLARERDAKENERAAERAARLRAEHDRDVARQNEHRLTDELRASELARARVEGRAAALEMTIGLLKAVIVPPLARSTPRSGRDGG